MTTRTQLLDFIKANPGVETGAIGTTFSISSSAAAARAKALLDGGFVTRKESRRLPTGVVVYGYYLNPAVTKAMNKTERRRTAPSKPSYENTVSTLPNDDMTSMIQSLSSALAGQIAAQVVVSLQSQLQQQLAAVIPPMTALPSISAAIPDFDDVMPVIHEPATYKSPSRPKLRKIGIVGLLPQQAGIISSEFGEAFDLHFWKEDGQNRLKSMAIGCEIILITKWASHAATDTISSAGGKWKKVHGSIDDLRTILTELFVKEAA